MQGKYKIFLDMIYDRYKQNEFIYNDIKDIVLHSSYLRAMVDRRMINKVRQEKIAYYSGKRKIYSVINVYKISDKYIKKLSDKEIRKFKIS